jgi:glycosyltransferase involved in cell wall biosynthesis
MDLMKVDKRLIISQFGEDECKKVGIQSKHIPIPLELEIWRKRTVDEKNSIKDIMGFKDKIVFFVNADGNERKALSLYYEALEIALKKNSKLHLVLLTRTDSPVSWKLSDLAMQCNVVNNVTVLNRGMGNQDVWKLYAMSDFVLNTSKAEGMGYSILEGMAVGVPVIATDATAMREHLVDNRGILLQHDYKFIDVFLNTYRYMLKPEKLADKMLEVSEQLSSNENYFEDMTNKARQYIENRTLNGAMEILENSLV